MVKLVVTDREGTELALEADPAISVMENIRDLDNSVEAICGGMCACATCHILVDPAWMARLAARSYEEQLMLQDLDAYDSERSRLSCQITLSDELDGLVFTVAPEEY